MSLSTNLKLVSLVVFLFFVGCKEPLLITDQELKNLLSNPRSEEQFHYIGTDVNYDYFVGEQWRKHSDPRKAKKSEIRYKIKNSSYINTRFPLTDDIKKWVTLKSEL